MGRRLYGRPRHPRGGDRVRLCEALEPRTLLSVNISGTAGNDTISLTVGAGGVLQATVNATTTTYTASQYSGGVTIDTKAGSDTLNIAALPAVQTSIQDEGRLTVNLGTAARGLLDIAASRVVVGNTNNGLEGPITLNVTDASDTTARHATISTTTSGNVGDTYNVLHGLSTGDIWFSAFHVTATTISTGGAGDSIDVNALGEFDAFPQIPQVGTVTLLVNHTGSKVNVGSPIVQPLFVEGVSGSVALVVDESFNQNITLQTAGTVAGNNVLGQLAVPSGFSPGAISFEASAMASVAINCGDNGNTIQVLGTPNNVTGGSTGPSINLNTGNGADTVAVKATSPGTVLNINGQDGVDGVNFGDAGNLQNVKGIVNVTNPLQFTYVSIDDSADAVSRTATLSTFSSGGTLFNSLAGLAPGVINFKGGDVPAAFISAGSGGNHLTVTSAAQATALTVNTGAGDDQVTISGSAVFTTMAFNGQGGDDSFVVDYTAGGIANGSTINLDGGAGTNSLRVIGSSTGGPYTVVAGKITYLMTTLSYTNIASLTLDPAMYNINADLGPISLTLAANATFNATQHLGALVIGTTGMATVAAGTSPYSKTLFLDTALVVVPGGKLDLTNNQLQLHYAAPAIVEIHALISNAYSGGTWSSWGITTSAADAGHGLGYVDSADGLIPTLPDHTILVRWARYGDLNLDGNVDFTDLLGFAQHYTQLNSNWGQGDFNYDGVVNFTDLLRLAQNYGGTTTAAPALVAAPPAADILPLRRKKSRAG